MTDLLTALSILFIVAGPFILLSNRLNLPTAPALLIAGVMASTVIDQEITLEITRFGIALLVFTFAVRIHLKDVETVVSESELIAFGQLGILGVLGFGGGMLLGLSPDQAIFLGVAAALSSSIVGTTLFLPRQLKLTHDRMSESIHAIQDFFGMFLLLIIGAGILVPDLIAQQLGYGIILVIIAIVIHRYLYDLVWRLSGGSNESMLVGTIALLIVFLGMAEIMGVSIVVGAFAAGMAVRDDYVQYSGVLNGIQSLTDFFAAIFFLTVGALLTLPTLDELGMSILLIGLAMIVKPAVTIGLMIYRGFERRTATLTAFNLDQVSEFAIIIAIEALVLGLLIPSVFDAIILAAAITLITSSFTRFHEERIYQLLAQSGLLGDYHGVLEKGSHVPEDLTDHVIIVGYGRHGRRLVEVCENNEVPYVVIENDPRFWDMMREDCSAYISGDIIEEETALKANLREARVIVSTPDAEQVSNHLVQYSDDLDVIVRTKQRSEAGRYLERGAIYVSVTDLLAADQLAGKLDALLQEDAQIEELREEAQARASPTKVGPRKM